MSRTTTVKVDEREIILHETNVLSGTGGGKRLVAKSGKVTRGDIYSGLFFGGKGQLEARVSEALIQEEKEKWKRENDEKRAKGIDVPEFLKDNQKQKQPKKDRYAGYRKFTMLEAVALLVSVIFTMIAVVIHGRISVATPWYLSAGYRPMVFWSIISLGVRAVLYVLLCTKHGKRDSGDLVLVNICRAILTVNALHQLFYVLAAYRYTLLSVSALLGLSSVIVAVSCGMQLVGLIKTWLLPVKKTR